jgi:acyl-CoA reductase-like NAD-dependent aldehyde dehydrogenase
VKAAKKAFRTWSLTTADIRARFLRAIADELEKRKPYLVELEVNIITRRREKAKVLLFSRRKNN